MNDIGADRYRSMEMSRTKMFLKVLFNEKTEKEKDE